MKVFLFSFNSLPWNKQIFLLKDKKTKKWYQHIDSIRRDIPVHIKLFVSVQALLVLPISVLKNEKNAVLWGHNRGEEGLGSPCVCLAWAVSGGQQGCLKNLVGSTERSIESSLYFWSQILFIKLNLFFICAIFSRGMFSRGDAQEHLPNSPLPVKKMLVSTHEYLLCWFALKLVWFLIFVCLFVDHRDLII